MKWLAIANPASGRRREAERLLQQLRMLRRLDAEIVHTAAPGDATRLARESASHDGVIVVGGDGTIAEVLQGLDLRRQCLAVLPAGHGNCLARDLLVGDAGRALAALTHGRLAPVDLMDIEFTRSDGSSERRLCASTLAVGYVTDVVTFGRQRLPQLGRAAYATAAMVVVPRTFDARLDGACDAGEWQRYTGLVINNTAHLANFRGFPDASVRDGLLEVMEQRHGWPRQLLHNAAVLAGSRRFGPSNMRQADCEHVRLAVPETFMADGELLYDIASARVVCRPAAVTCIVGAP